MSQTSWWANILSQFPSLTAPTLPLSDGFVTSDASSLTSESPVQSVHYNLNPTRNAPSSIPPTQADSITSCDLSPTRDVSMPPSIPPIPKSIAQTDSVATALELVDQWLQASLACSDEKVHHVLNAMATQLKETLREKYALKEVIDSVEVTFKTARKQVVCKTCGELAILPHILPCSHMSCGSCLENSFRDILEQRINGCNASSSDGIPLRELLHTHPMTEEAFQLALHRCGLGYDTDFTTYPSPCCGKSVSSKPLLAYGLRSICTSIRLDRGKPEPSMPEFKRLFLRPI